MLDLYEVKKLVIEALDMIAPMICPDCDRPSCDWRRFATESGVEDWLRKQPNVADTCAEAMGADKG